MTRKKPAQVRLYRPEYLSIDSLAYLLDISAASVRRYVQTGDLPAPVTIGGLKRWRWLDVEAHLDSMAGHEQDAGDDFATGIKTHVTQTMPPAARRAPH